MWFFCLCEQSWQCFFIFYHLIKCNIEHYLQHFFLKFGHFWISPRILNWVLCVFTSFGRTMTHQQVPWGLSRRERRILQSFPGSHRRHSHWDVSLLAVQCVVFQCKVISQPKRQPTYRFLGWLVHQQGCEGLWEKKGESIYNKPQMGAEHAIIWILWCERLCGAHILHKQKHGDASRAKYATLYNFPNS